jgi:hemolysin activation/secretion protein
MRHLVSAGGGVRARWGDRGDFNLLLAVPLERVPGQSQLGPARVLLTFTTRLVPWSVQ